MLSILDRNFHLYNLPVHFNMEMVLVVLDTNKRERMFGGQGKSKKRKVLVKTGKSVRLHREE